jgi:hypothetical protein
MSAIEPSWIGYCNPADELPEDITECTDCETRLPTDRFFVVEEYVGKAYISVPYCGKCFATRVEDMLASGYCDVTHEETDYELIIKIKRK